ncbi:YHYH domain-containing protein [Methylophilus sp. 5]|nr:YHYH domain-containing protein [Methylophilus sp. 5]
MKYLLLAAVILISSVNCYAHSGGTDKNGCHHDRKTGGYHCH